MDKATAERVAQLALDGRLDEALEITAGNATADPRSNKKKGAKGGAVYVDRSVTSRAKYGYKITFLASTRKSKYTAAIEEMGGTLVDVRASLGISAYGDKMVAKTFYLFEVEGQMFLCTTEFRPGGGTVTLFPKSLKLRETKMDSRYVDDDETGGDYVQTPRRKVPGSRGRGKGLPAGAPPRWLDGERNPAYEEWTKQFPEDTIPKRVNSETLADHVRAVINSGEAPSNAKVKQKFTAEAPAKARSGKMTAWLPQTWVKNAGPMGGGANVKYADSNITKMVAQAGFKVLSVEYGTRPK